MRVAEAVGRGLAGLGVNTVFGVVGSGNFHVTNALVAGGARFVAARHEGGATVMADAWARTTGVPGVVTVHQGPGLTNAMTGIAEAAKSRTPLLVLAAEAPEIRSNFHVDVAGLAAAVGAVGERLYSPASAVADAHRAYATALGRRTVILALPLNVWNLDVSGGFATPLAAELIGDADVIVGWGCSLNMWTTRHGKLISPQATLVQVDDDPAAIGVHRPVHLGVPGDVAQTARPVASALADGGSREEAGREARPVRDHESAGAAWRWIRATSWAIRACSCPFPTRRASASPRRSSRSGSAWPRRSGPRSPGRTGWRWPRSATAAR